MFYNLAFEFFSFMISSCAFMVVLAGNPVHAVLYLVLVFMFSSWLLLLSGGFFMGALLMQIYAGAVAVLFLFCVMMLTPFSGSDLLLLKRQSSIEFFFICLGVNFVQFFYWIAFFIDDVLAGFILSDNFLFFSTFSLVDFAYVLYTYYSIVFILLGYVLLLAMLGSIVLTLSHRLLISRQVISVQVSRDLSLFFLK